MAECPGVGKSHRISQPPFFLRTRAQVTGCAGGLRLQIALLDVPSPACSLHLSLVLEVCRGALHPAKMLMSKKNRLAIYATLFRGESLGFAPSPPRCAGLTTPPPAIPDGVFVVAKDSSLEKHLTLDIPNIHALDAGKSLLNRGHVRETFSW